MDVESSSDADELPVYPIKEESVGGFKLDPFHYYDAAGTPTFLTKILSDDVEYVVNYVNEHKELNLKDNHGNGPLHIAVLMENEKMLSYLLSLSNLKRNERNHKGFTPFLSSFVCKNDNVIKELIEGGCDITIASLADETALHFAVTSNKLGIAQILIERGIDINATDFDGCTALHYAVFESNLEALCMLLCYGAVADMANNSNLTPLMLSFTISDCEEISKVLYDFTVPNDYRTDDGYDTLLLALNIKSELSVALIVDGYSVNSVTDSGHNALFFSIFYSNSDVFKYIFERFDFKVLLPAYGATRINFLIHYLSKCEFCDSEFLECLFLLLNCPVILELVSDTLLMKFVLLIRYKRGVTFEQCMEVIYTLLSLGIEMQLYDLDYLYRLIGKDFEKELEYFLFMNIKHNVELTRPAVFDSYLLVYRFILEDEVELGDVEMNNENVIKYFGYLNKFSIRGDGRVIKVYDRVPSLQDISRNAAREYIKNELGANNSCRFYTVLNSLDLPDVIKSIISFKKPLYVIESS